MRNFSFISQLSHHQSIVDVAIKCFLLTINCTNICVSIIVNNALWKKIHLKKQCQKVFHKFTIEIFNFCLFNRNIFFNRREIFLINVTKITFTNTIKFSIINFDVNASKNVKIDYEFHDWIYVKKKCSLIEKNESNNVCFDIDAKITLIDANFFRRQNSNVFIRKMIFSLTIRELNITQHQSANYVIVLTYFSSTKNEFFFVTLIRREMHLINHLKINMLIDNDVIDSKDIVIDSINKKTFIRNCDVKMLVEIRTREIHVQQRSIHTKKIITFSSRNQLTNFVHHFVDELSFDRDFLFESNDIECQSLNSWIQLRQLLATTRHFLCVWKY